MAPIRVVINGVSGKMGVETLKALSTDKDVQPVGGVARKAQGDALSLPDGSGAIPYGTDLDSVVERTKPDVIVDFTAAAGAREAAKVAAERRVHFVTGTTGLSPADLAEIDRRAREANVGAIVAANFAVGAVFLMHLAKLAARHFEHAEIIEMHHDRKLDAPSGTALATARMMAEARDKGFTENVPEKVTLDHTRGGSFAGISIHSVRLPGLMAHQEVILGAAGQTLTLRHDAISRECYMPGVLLAVKKVGQTQGLTVGMERLMGLE
jgi:4-hydroxy-tetrahydrodipicolinate reductase